MDPVASPLQLMDGGPKELLQPQKLLEQKVE